MNILYKCRECGKTGPEKLFTRNRGKPANWCKECAARYARNRPERNAKRVAWTKEFPTLHAAEMRDYRRRKSTGKVKPRTRYSVLPSSPTPGDRPSP